ncbi:MAG: signal peptidase I [Planctomycetota bacterium]|nr:signal peptidase I [Planctomycetota bacterium]
MSAENNADQRRLSSGDTQVNITPDEPSRIGRGRYSNLPASFFEVETDLQSMSRTQLNELLLALQEREEQVPPEPRNQTEHVNLSDKREPSTDLPPERRVAMVYDPDAELQRQEDEFASRRKKESKGSQALGFIHAIIVALLMAVVIRYFVFEAFKIPSGSMEPTLIGDEDTGDHVFVNKLVYSIRDPYRWEVVVFKKPGENRNLIKRCAGLPGEELELSGGEVYANGAMLRKPYELLDQFWRPYFRQTDFSDMLLSRNWRVIGDTRIIGKSLRASGPCELHYIPWERTVENGLVTKSVITDIYPRLSVLERAVTSQGKIFRPSGKGPFHHSRQEFRSDPPRAL